MHTAQAIVDSPGNVAGTPINARAMWINWTHSGVFGGSSTQEARFVITLFTTNTDEVTTTVIEVDDRDARTYLAVGLIPYDYITTNGVEYVVTVRAMTLDPDENSTSVPSYPVTLPRKLAGRF